MTTGMIRPVYLANAQPASTWASYQLRKETSLPVQVSDKKVIYGFNDSRATTCVDKWQLATL
jgi:hypothetical protein